MNSITVMKKLKSIEDLPTLPAIAIEVNKMLQDYDTSIKNLTKTIEKDQAMVPRILKLVNSAFFGFKSKISSVEHAIILLGFNTVRNAVVSIAIIDALSLKGELEDFDITTFWTHSIAVAVTSKYLAEKTRLQSPENSFTGGLLHDTGKVVLACHFQDFFKKVLLSMKDNNLSFYEAEVKEIPITHTQIGKYLANKWRLPDSLVDVIQYHHTVNHGANDFDLLMIVHVADNIVNSLLADSKNSIDYSSIYPDAKKVMESQLETSSEWFPELMPEIESARQFFLGGS